MRVDNFYLAPREKRKMNPWNKKRIERRKEELQRLAYLDFLAARYKETADYAIEQFLFFCNYG